MVDAPWRNVEADYRAALQRFAKGSERPVSVPVGRSCGHPWLSTPYRPLLTGRVAICRPARSMQLSIVHLRRATRGLDGPQASAPLPPIRRRGSGSGPLADGTPSSPSNSPDVRRPHRLPVAGADRRNPRAATTHGPGRARRHTAAPVARGRAGTGAGGRRFAAARGRDAQSRQRRAVDCRRQRIVRAVFSNRGATLDGVGARATTARRTASLSISSRTMYRPISPNRFRSSWTTHRRRRA